MGSDIDMRQCPVCKAYMNFKMNHSYGNAFCYYTCNCGYDTRKEHTTYSSTSLSQDIHYKNNKN